MRGSPQHRQIYIRYKLRDDHLEQASCGHNRAVLELFEDRFSAEEIEALAEMLARLPGALDESLACPTDV